MNPKQKRCWKRRSVWISSVIFVLLLTGLLGAKISSKYGLKREIETIRARGLPTTFVELDAWHKHVPDQENLALVIIEAGKKHYLPAYERNPNMMGWSWRELRTGERLPPKLAGAAADYVSRNKETIEKLHSGAGLTRSRYPIDLTSFPAKTPPLGSVKSLIQLLQWDAILKAENGDGSGARKSLKAGFTVAASLEDEPAVMSTLVRMACLAIQSNTIEAVLNRMRLEENALMELAQAAQRAEEKGKLSLHRVAVGERATGLSYFTGTDFDMFDTMVSLGNPPRIYDDLPESARMVLFHLWRAVMKDREANFFVRQMGRWEQAVGLEYREMLHGMERVGREVEEAKSERGMRYLIAEVILPPMQLTTQKEARLAAELRCLRGGMAVERYRRRNGEVVPQVAELVPDYIKEWPVDPIDGKPLVLERNANGGFKVQAMGATELANEGRSRGSTNWYEVAFTVDR